MKYTDEEFNNIINDIISNETVKSLRIFKHHYGSNRYEHSLSVSYLGYKICKFLGLDHISVARRITSRFIFIWLWKSWYLSQKSY